MAEGVEEAYAQTIGVPALPVERAVPELTAAIFGSMPAGRRAT